ncbi:MAG: pyruvate dehydrogenase (acetyl-transferring), homodimeric type, partial [Actinobacteria bacterium]|nr:pyruvate dehydrogenase (acetyl-transferring), homodimeric type [Actinomycetota bacterium]
MAHEGFIHQLPDNDPVETLEWLESLDSVISTQGIERARYVLLRLLERARNLGVGIGGSLTTPYVNTIPVESQTAYPGDLVVERSIRAAVRWNAVAMVDRANHRFNGLGGHLSTYASAASLYEVGFNHFFRGPEVSGGGDQVFFQGHASPGIYARAFLEHRLTPERLDGFRRQASVRGLPSYPHPRRMPDFWQFPTVSMGLGPLNAVAQARFNRYLSQRGIIDVSDARVWCFVGDGEMDEPESLAAIAIAGRESLENLIFVVNCNLQRLDGPVRGNSKVIQEFESLYSGAGWSVIKAIWGSGWDPLLAEDSEGVLVNRMNEVPDGEFQRYSVEAGSYIREQFFGSDPRLLSLVANLSDEDLERLPRGGHDFDKIFNAYARAMELNGKPTVVLAKTVKGWALGDNVEGRNATHQIKKLSKVDLLALRDRLAIPVSDSEFEDGLAPYFRFEKGSEEFEYLAEKRNMLGGWIPQRRSVSVPLAMPDDEVFEEFKQGSPEGSTASTTTAFTR